MSTDGPGSADSTTGISLTAFCTALASSLVVFGVQTGFFLLLRNKLARIFKPKTYLVPERERTDPPPISPWGLVTALLKIGDREIIRKCGLDAYFFLRYLQTLLIIFIPMAVVIIPILVPINFVGGISRNFTNSTGNDTTSAGPISNVTGLDTLAWGNVSPTNTNRYWAHLIMAVLLVIWVCGVIFAEMRVYIKVRQDYLTTAEHRLRASATTVLVSAIPEKWLTEEALRGLFDVFPGGIRNIWLTRDLTQLLDKIKQRDAVHKKLEDAQTKLIRMAKKNQLKQQKQQDKKARKATKTKAETKEERAAREKQEDDAARLRAEGGGGVSSGDQHETSQDVSEEVHNTQQAEMESGQSGGPPEQGAHERDHVLNIPGLSTGVSKITQGLGKGVGVVGKTVNNTGQEFIGGARNISKGLDSQVGTTNGFVALGEPTTSPNRPSHAGAERRRVQLPDEEELPRPSTQGSEKRKMSSAGPLESATTMSTAGGRFNHSRNGSVVSQDPMLQKGSIELRNIGNTTRRPTNLSSMVNEEKAKWYEFWKPPTGGFASPIPQGADTGEFPFKKKSFWQELKMNLPFMGGEVEQIEYPKAYDEAYDEDKEDKAEWEKWLKKSDRPTHRLHRLGFTPDWVPGLPLINKKVDTIFWCREELARLNLEIEMDQKSPERYPLMRSAFIQFNHQVAAHMACQSIVHHIPEQMAPRMVEIAPNDVLWENMAVSWWAAWIRTAAVIIIVIAMILLWTFPISFTSSLSQIDSLIARFPWLGFLTTNGVVFAATKALAGVLPAILIGILLWLVPIIMDFLAGIQGSKTGAQKSEAVQWYYFAFLFVEVFLVVTLSAGIFSALDDIRNNPTSIASILAQNLPKAANYFFSYMILQALSVSSGTLLQIGALVNWYIIAKIFNNTPRSKWNTNTKLPTVQWGSYFPVYTNFACIGLIYAVVAPIISIFAIITFSLLWVANRYTMIYVNRLSTDTGGVLYPKALYQTFVGLYVMCLCLIGLFFLVRDQDNNLACVPQAIIMIVVTFLIVVYHFLLNSSFGAMFRYLPITFEDEAVLRDEAFQRAQDRRLGLVDDDEDDDDLDKENLSAHRRVNSAGSVGSKTNRANKFSSFNPVKGVVHAGTWAIKGGKNIKHAAFGKAEESMSKANEFRRNRRAKDLEAQRAIGDALYGGFHDEIEDLTPEERDILTRRAFMHSALRAHRPTVWIPRDDLGVSDDEIRRTQEFSEHIWISNEGTALDSKVRVVYGRAPPDFSELDIINL